MGGIPLSHCQQCGEARKGISARERRTLKKRGFARLRGTWLSGGRDEQLRTSERTNDAKHRRARQLAHVYGRREPPACYCAEPIQMAAGSTSDPSDGKKQTAPLPGPKHRSLNPKRADSSIDVAFIYVSKPTSTHKPAKRKKIFSGSDNAFSHSRAERPRKICRYSEFCD